MVTQGGGPGRTSDAKDIAEIDGFPVRVDGFEVYGRFNARCYDARGEAVGAEGCFDLFGAGGRDAFGILAGASSSGRQDCC